MYAAAADAVNAALPNALHVLSHLLGMSIELALKAYLRKAGFSEKDLRNLGHNLGNLLAAATKKGLLHTGSRNFVLNVLGANYGQRLFAYPEEGVMNVILPWRVREVTQEIIEEVFCSINGDQALLNLIAAPGLCIRSSYPEDLDATAWANPPGSNRRGENTPNVDGGG